MTSDPNKTDPNIVDVTATTFDELVIERSHEVPILIDFWADWCGPCKTLGPVLERVAQKHQGAFVLARIDTDAYPSLARRYQVQGIPAVKAIRNGKLVDQFVGALPESEVEAFVAGVLPSEAEGLVKDGNHHLFGGDLKQAEECYQAALASDGAFSGALLGMGRVRLRQKLFEEAGSFFSQIPVGSPEEADVQRERSLVGLYSRLDEVVPREEAEELLRADPTDGEAAYAMGVYLVLEARYQEALDYLFLSAQSECVGERPREAMLEIFNILGSEHELSQQYRAQLANFLF